MRHAWERLEDGCGRVDALRLEAGAIVERKKRDFDVTRFVS
jgi:hypothetical protein